MKLIFSKHLTIHETYVMYDVCFTMDIPSFEIFFKNIS